MKTKLSLVILTVLLLTACGSKTASTPAGTLPPIATNAPSNTLAPVSTDTSPAALSGKVDVAIAGFAFDPATLTIKVGTTVTWTNQDTAVHNVKADDNSWGSNDLNKGDTFSFTFNQAGTYAYRCGFHANMKGTITVIP